MTRATSFWISTNAQLDALATYVNNGGSTITQEGKTYFFELTNDINFGQGTESNFTPIDTTQNPFKGRFNGNGFKISNMRILNATVPAGFFWVAGWGYNSINTSGTNYHNQFATIAGLVFDNCQITTVDGPAAIVCGEVNQDCGEYIRNCYVVNSSILSTTSDNQTTPRYIGVILGKDDPLQNNSASTLNDITMANVDGTTYTTHFPIIYNCYAYNVKIRGY